MSFNFISVLTKLLLSIVVMVFAQAHAAEERKGDGLLPEQDLSLHKKKFVHFSKRETQRLLLEQTLWVEANDGSGTYKEPCYRLIFEKDGKLGSNHILLSNHIFPFSWLPYGHKKSVLSSDFVMVECSQPKEDKEILKRLHEVESLTPDWPPLIPEVYVAPGPFFYPWYDEISPDAQDLITKHFYVKHLGSDKAAISSLFNQYSPAWFFLRIASVLAEKRQGMDHFAEQHFGSTLELESYDEPDATIELYVQMPIHKWIKPIQDFMQAINSGEDTHDLEDMSREDMIARNKSWITNTLFQAFQAEKLGLLMFGADHADGPYGVITFIKKTLAENKIWKGIRFLRLEQLKKRRWEEAPRS